VSTTPPPDDDELLAVLAHAARLFDAPPAELTEANKELLSWRDPDAALAELVADSRELAGAARGQGDEVVLRFDSDEASIVVQVESTGAGAYLLLGQVEPTLGAAEGTVALRRPDAEVIVPCDEWGRFRVERVAQGPVSFRWTPTAGSVAPLETAWTLL
jgi:hypothetical protein